MKPNNSFLQFIFFWAWPVKNCVRRLFSSPWLLVFHFPMSEVNLWIHCHYCDAFHLYGQASIDPACAFRLASRVLSSLCLVAYRRFSSPATVSIRVALGVFRVYQISWAQFPQRHKMRNYVETFAKNIAWYLDAQAFAHSIFMRQSETHVWLDKLWDGVKINTLDTNLHSS